MAKTSKKPEEAPQAEQARPGARARTHARFGWTLLAVTLLSGTVLEALEGLRWAPLAADAWRQRLWSLAHFHGAALGLLNLVYAAWADAPALDAARRARASVTLRLGCLALPLGFLLGGIGHTESDPSLGILLSPVGALLILYTAALQTRAAWRDPA